jgi:hypothetical protein
VSVKSEDFGHLSLSVIIISRQALAGTWFAQPSLGHFIIEWIEAEH